MSYALKLINGKCGKRVTRTTYHGSADSALCALGNETMSVWPHPWHTAECWHVNPAPMGGDDEKLKRKWKIKRDV